MRGRRSFALRFASPASLAFTAALAAFALPRVAHAQTVVYAENWESGTSDWTAVDGNPIVITSDTNVCSSQFTRETIGYSAGRVFMRHGIPVTANAQYCLTTWARGSAGTKPFLGINLSNQLANSLSTEHWLIGDSGFGTGYGDTVTPITSDGAWHWYSKAFTMDSGASFIVIKDELWSGGGAGTGDFDDIVLYQGACPAAPTTGAVHTTCANACDTRLGQCVACTSNTSCSGTAPLCDTTQPSTVCGTADEGYALSVTCPSGTITSIDFASYGTPSGACGGFATSSCSSATSMAVVTAACVGQSSCTVNADNATFGDPCGGIYKHLYMQVHCSSGGGETCTACNGDNGSLSSFACPAADAPICEANGACGQCSATNAGVCSGTSPVCDTSTFTCAGCNGNSGSGATLACPVSAPYCQAGGACSATCVNDTDCGNGNWCSAGACVPTLVDGSPCDRPAECTAGVCTNGACGTPVIDAGTDSGPEDSGTDSGAIDSGTDTGATDSGTDTGAIDSGADSGVADAGHDSGTDSGVADAGHDATTDSGSTDAGDSGAVADAGHDSGGGGADSGPIDSGPLNDAGFPADATASNDASHGTDSSADGSVDNGDTSGGGGCSCTSAGESDSSFAGFGALVGLALALRARRRRQG